MKDKEKLGEKIRRAFEIDEIMPKGSLIVLRGAGNMKVGDCKKILLYSENEIRLQIIDCVLIIKGRGLYCASFYEKSVRVLGEISSLEFDKGGT